MKLYEEFKLFEEMWDEPKEIIGFIDCSGSNSSESVLAVQQKIAKQLGVTSYYYFADKIYTSAQDVTDYSTNYRAIYTFAKKHTDKTIIVLTDEDIDHNPDGEALKKLPNVKIERIESHLKNIEESAKTFAVVFVGNKRNEDALLNKVAKTNPVYTTIVHSIHDFLRKYDEANIAAVRATKFYTDTEGMAEVEEACARMPERMSRPILDAITLVEEACSLKEAVPTTTREIMNRYQDNVANHIVELEHEKAFEDAEWFENGWYVLESVEVYPDYYKLIVDRPIETDIDAEAIIGYAFEPANIIGMDEAMSEGGVVYDEGGNWIYIERWVVEQDKTITESSEFVTQSECDFKKEFISAVLKGHPERKAACETLNKFDFRNNGNQFSLDIQNGVITLPQLIIEQDKDFRNKWLLKNLYREFRKLTAAMETIAKIKDCLEDACIDLR